MASINRAYARRALAADMNWLAPGVHADDSHFADALVRGSAPPASDLDAAGGSLWLLARGGTTQELASTPLPAGSTASNYQASVAMVIPIFSAAG
jgi:hypothetical protein